jgi:phosphodiesterase/alkaline phosphatase D-like protein
VHSVGGGEDPWQVAQQNQCETSPASSLPYSAATDVSVALKDLEPGTGYHYRLAVSNTTGDVRAVGTGFATVGSYGFSTTYGVTGSGDGQLLGPQDVAIDNSTGDIYVADTGNDRVVKFNSAGNFVAAWGWGVDDGTAAAQVCTSGCQAGISGVGPGQLGSPRFVEVDNSNWPSAGSVYVFDSTAGRVQKFDPSGTLVSSWRDGGAFDVGGSIGGLSVDTLGDLVVLSSMSCENPRFGHQVCANDFEDDVDVTGVVLDRSTNDLYVDHGNYIHQFPTSNKCNLNQSRNGTTPSGEVIPGVRCRPSDFFGIGDLDSAGGLAFNPSTGAIYAANTGDDEVVVFTRLPRPQVVTGEVADQKPSSGKLTGSIAPLEPGGITSCHFEYGTDTSYTLGSVPCSPAAPLAGPADVSATLAGLTPYATYHYRLVAAGANELSTYGQDRAFMPAPALAPTVSGTTSAGETPSSATLSAQVNPNGSRTLYRFQYGTDLSYGSQTALSPSIGEDNVDHQVSTTIGNLDPGNEYHFRVLAINFNGVVGGPDRTFTTPDSPSVRESSSSGVTKSAAFLKAQIRPGFRSTTYRFEYGTTPSYGLSTAQSALLAIDNIPHPVSEPLGGLTPGTTYHFRVVAINIIGTAVGPDLTLTTAPEERAVPPPPKPCKKGYVRKHGKCVKKRNKRKQHKRGRRHG